MLAQEIAQTALEAYFGWRPALRLQPPFEILQGNLVFNLGLFDDNRNNLTTADGIDPIVLAKHAKTLGHCLIEGVCRDLNRVLAPAKIGTRHRTCAKCHDGLNRSIFAFCSLEFRL